MKMKERILLGWLALSLVAGMVRLAQDKIELGYIPDAMAAVAQTGPAVACTDPSIAAFQGALAYTITWSAPAAGSASSPSVTAAISNAVNGDTAPSVIPTLNGTGAAAGFLILMSRSPTGKIGGLQCQTNTDDLKIEIHGDGTDNDRADMAWQRISDDDNSYDASKRCDNASSTAKDVLFGTGGQISTSLLLDGTRDFDGVADGEITYGGTNETHGGMEIHFIVDVVEYNVQAATDVETLTFTTTTQ